MCLYVLSSVLWYPLRFPHKNDALSVFTSSCLIYVICVCLRRVVFNAYSVVFLFRFLRLVYPTGARGTDHPPFSNFLFTNLFSIKFLYFFIISSLFPYFNLFVSIFIQSYVNIKLHVSTLYRGGSRWRRGVKSWFFTRNTQNFSRLPPQLEKIWFFGVKSWFFTRNTPKMFAPPSARRYFLKCDPP